MTSDDRPFIQKLDKMDQDGLGKLRFGGYCGPEASVRKIKYLLAEDRNAEVEVEVGRYPAEYPYVVHDFYGVFRDGAYAQSADRKPEESMSLVQYTPPGAAKPAVLCRLRHPASEDRGAIGWYRVGESEIVTVVIGYENLRGIPIRVLDALLAEWPSGVPADDPEAANWKPKDATKWQDLLQKDPAIPGVLEQAARVLKRETGSSFSIEEAIRLRTAKGDAFEQAVMQVRSGLEDWVQEGRAPAAP